MKRLVDELNIDCKINKIEKNTIEETIDKAFNSNEYNFYLNSELIDVNDRFRVFEFNNEKYIVKKTKKEDGIDEERIALKAKDLLNDIEIDNYTIKIVTPKLYEVNNKYYIVTKYLGTTLQENIYSNENSNIDINIIFSILDVFLKKGVLYRGFLPRNTIVIDKTIYLLDWEDAFFENDNKLIGINRLWKTNFLLNWSYLYDIELLRSGIKRFEKDDIEPQLLKYEMKFSRYTGFEGNDIDLREKIMSTVLRAERKVSYLDNDFCIPPNDLAHLVSDLFNSDIDVLFDLSCYLLRNKNEEAYYKKIKELSNIIINSYKNNEIIQKKAIIPVLDIFEMCINDNFKYIDNGLLLSKLYLTNHNNFSNYLNKCINDLLSEFSKKEINIVFSDLIEYLKEL